MSRNRAAFRITIALTVFALIWSAIPAGAAAVRVTPIFYNMQNGALINGWHWMTSPAAVGTWRLHVNPADLNGADLSTFYILMDAAVTNDFNGGSGYARSVKLQVRSGTGPWVPITVELVNPFRPIDPADSAGLGYAVYGIAQINDQALLRDFMASGDLRIRFAWTDGYHVAVKADTIKISFSK
jgi:hypothetical protein